MGRETPIITNFTAGELSPYLYGRTDLQAYFNGCREMYGYIPLRYGAAEKRGGTRFCGTIKNEAAGPIKWLRFLYSADPTQVYSIEAGAGYFRFWVNDGNALALVLGGDNQPYEVATPYTAADLPSLYEVGLNDVLYICDGAHRPQVLKRLGHANWTLSDYDFADGPYLRENTTETKLTASATTGTVTVTASAATGINGGDGFKATDVGRHIRIKKAAGTDADKDGDDDWGWARITAVTSATVVTAEVKEDFDAQATGGSSTWRLGLWSNTTGWPTCAAFHEERLVFGSTTIQDAARLDASAIGDYGGFAPGTEAADALSLVIAAEAQNKIRWLTALRVLTCGTAGAEHPILPFSGESTLAPGKVSAIAQTEYGSAAVRPVKVGNSILFLQYYGRELLDWRYDYSSDSFDAEDRAELSPHVLSPKLLELAYAHAPHRLVFGRRSDGMLVSCTYVPRQKVQGWVRYPLGGAGFVEGIVTIPGPDANRLVLQVRRTINGQTRRYVELLTDPLPLDGNQDDCFYCDCGSTYDGAPTTTISGLDYLEGETVQVFADGAEHPDCVVTGGAIALDREAHKVHVGYPVAARLRPMLIDAGAREGTAQGKKKVIKAVTVRVLRSLGGIVGRDEEHFEPILSDRDPSQPMDTPMPLESVDVTVQFPGGAVDTGGSFYVECTGPWPSTVCALIPRVETDDA